MLSSSEVCSIDILADMMMDFSIDKMDNTGYRSLFRYQDRKFIGYQAQLNSFQIDNQKLISLVEAGIARLHTENNGGVLLLPVRAEQICDQDLMTVLLDRLLKLRFSWRNVVLIIQSLSENQSLEQFNQAAYRLHSCQLQLWLAAPLYMRFQSLCESMLFDTVYFDYSEYSKKDLLLDSISLQQLYSSGITVVFSEPPKSLVDELFEHSSLILASFDSDIFYLS
ncbi:MAG: hypothetical protein CENE_00827 [Candidatus Celerinatantimonas neptuna]|nr:MAG: hypothetical protein CENE_00827 [Candidatus Celerinatantimonas neptuna]